MIVNDAGKIEFTARFDKFENSTSLSSMCREADTVKRRFRIDYADGAYIVFTGAPRMISLDSEALVDIEDVQIEERGNIYDREGSD